MNHKVPSDLVKFERSTLTDAVLGGCPQCLTRWAVPSCGQTVKPVASLPTELVSDWFHVQVPLTDGAPPPKYTFDKYNRPLEIPEYSDEEYSRVLQDPRWSREETDHLWGLARQFELRFIVMADRWALPKARSVEEMKERYYSVAKKLLLARAQDEEDVADHPLIKVSAGSRQLGAIVWPRFRPSSWPRLLKESIYRNVITWRGTWQMA